MARRITRRDTADVYRETLEVLRMVRDVLTRKVGRVLSLDRIRRRVVDNQSNRGDYADVLASYTTIQRELADLIADVMVEAGELDDDPNTKSITGYLVYVEDDPSIG